MSMRVLALAALACLAADLAAAQVAGPTGPGAGNWDLRRSGDGAAPDSACMLIPKTQSRIQVGGKRLTVTGLPKNSVFNYQYRIDDKPASTPAIPPADMQNAGEIYFEGDVFNEILSGQRFRIRILDRWHEAITEDVDLAGLDALHGRMRDACTPGGAATGVR